MLKIFKITKLLFSKSASFWMHLYINKTYDQNPEKYVWLEIQLTVKTKTLSFSTLAPGQEKSITAGRLAAVQSQWLVAHPNFKIMPQLLQTANSVWEVRCPERDWKTPEEFGLAVSQALETKILQPPPQHTILAQMSIENPIMKLEGTLKHASLSRTPPHLNDLQIQHVAA